MNPEYTWLTVGNWHKGRRNFLDIMAAPISEPSVFLQEIQNIIRLRNVTVCIGGELKTSEEGKPASNFRYEKDQELNGNVIENYIQLFNLYKEIYTQPIFVTTIPRSWRKYSWFIQEDGIMVRKDQEYRKRAEDPLDPISHQGFPSGEDAMDIVDVDFMRFLSYNCVMQEHMIKIRECCKGARYHTYLADMISFLYQLHCNQDEFSDKFYPEYRDLDVINEQDKPDKLVFEKTMNNGFVFLCPKKTSVDSIYRDFEEAISLKENEMKSKIRKHLLENRVNRWTDFSANDTDDAFTILMMIHSFNGLVGERNEHGCSEGIYYSPCEEEKVILDGLHSSLENWRSELE